MSGRDGNASFVAALSALGLGLTLADQLLASRLRPSGAVITELCRYPIKSLSREALTSVAVQAEGAFPGDREWALLRGAYVSEHDPSCSRWLHKTKFHVMMLDEQLSALRVAYAASTQRLEIREKDGGAMTLETTLDSEAGRRKAEEFFVKFLGEERLDPSVDGSVPLKLVRSDIRGHAFHNHR